MERPFYLRALRPVLTERPADVTQITVADAFVSAKVHLQNLISQIELLLRDPHHVTKSK